MLTLTDAEKSEVRMLTGKWTTEADLTDTDIDTESILGEASDYVMDQVTTDIDISKISGYSDIDVLRRTAINTFITLLDAVQRRCFRRAVVFRAAGIAVELLAPVFVEGSNAIVTQRREVPKWQDLQVSHFAKSDRQIARIKSIYPDDAYLTDSESFAILV